MREVAAHGKSARSAVSSFIRNALGVMSARMPCETFGAGFDYDGSAGSYSNS